MTNLYQKTLTEIPDAYLGDVFTHAGKISKFFPKPAHIIESWNLVKMDIPELEPKEVIRPGYLDVNERMKILEVSAKYPQFKELLDELDIEANPNGVPDDDWWHRFNVVMRVLSPNVAVSAGAGAYV